MQGTFDSAEVTALEDRNKELEFLISGMALIMKDEKGKVRINKQILNQVNGGKIESMGWTTNAAGAIIVSVVMA